MFRYILIIVVFCSFFAYQEGLGQYLDLSNPIAQADYGYNENGHLEIKFTLGNVSSIQHHYYDSIDVRLNDLENAHLLSSKIFYEDGSEQKIEDDQEARISGTYGDKSVSIIIKPRTGEALKYLKWKSVDVKLNLRFELSEYNYPDIPLNKPIIVSTPNVRIRSFFEYSDEEPVISTELRRYKGEESAYLTLELKEDISETKTLRIDEVYLKYKHKDGQVNHVADIDKSSCYFQAGQKYDLKMIPRKAAEIDSNSNYIAEIYTSSGNIKYKPVLEEVRLGQFDERFRVVDIVENLEFFHVGQDTITVVTNINADEIYLNFMDSFFSNQEVMKIKSLPHDDGERNRFRFPIDLSVIPDGVFNFYFSGVSITNEKLAENSFKIKKDTRLFLSQPKFDFNSKDGFVMDFSLKPVEMLPRIKKINVNVGCADQEKTIVCDKKDGKFNLSVKSETLGKLMCDSSEYIDFRVLSPLKNDIYNNNKRHATQDIFQFKLKYVSKDSLNNRIKKIVKESNEKYKDKMFGLIKKDSDRERYASTHIKKAFRELGLPKLNEYSNEENLDANPYVQIFRSAHEQLGKNSDTKWHQNPRWKKVMGKVGKYAISSLVLLI